MNNPTLTIKAMATSLAVLNAEVSAVLGAAKSMPVHDAIKAWHGLREAYDSLDEHRKELFQMLELASRDTIPGLMAEAGIKTISLDDIGYRFTVAYRFSCSMIDKEQGIEWLRENDLGGIIQETVNASTLAAMAKRRLEDEGRDMPPEIFKTGQMAYTSATKLK